MTINDVVNEVMNRLGMRNDYIFYSMDAFDIQEYIENYTLELYSRYRPYVFSTIIYFKEEDILDYSLGSAMKHGSITYRMPKEIRDLADNGLRIFSAGKLEPYYANRINDAMGNAYVRNIDGLSGINIGEQAYAMSAFAMAVPRLKAEFVPPDKIIIKNGTGHIHKNQPYQIRLSCYHPKNLKTLKDGHFERFKKLALLDVAHHIYHNDLKFIDQMNTGNTTTDLKLDLFEDIDTKLNDYIDELKAVMALDGASSWSLAIQ